MPESMSTAWYIVPIVVAALIFVAAVLLEMGARKSIAIKKLAEVLKSGAFLSSTFLSIAVGIILIYAGTMNFLLAPGLGLEESLFHLILRYSQIVIGIGLVLGIFIRIMNVGVIAVFVAGFFAFPVLEMFDYVIFLGIGIFLFLVHRDALSFSFFFHPVDKKEFFDQYRKYALPILRFITGFGLAYAAFHHNIIDYGPAVEFIQQKPLLNFMQSIFGVESFTHELFSFYSGVFAILLGVLLAFGLLERLASTIIAIGLLLTILIGGLSFLPIMIPYFAVIYIIITGNQFEEREKIAKSDIGK